MLGVVSVKPAPASWRSAALETLDSWICAEIRNTIAETSTHASRGEGDEAHHPAERETAPRPGAAPAAQPAARVEAPPAAVDLVVGAVAAARVDAAVVAALEETRARLVGGVGAVVFVGHGEERCGR